MNSFYQEKEEIFTAPKKANMKVEICRGYKQCDLKEKKKGFSRS